MTRSKADPVPGVVNAEELIPNDVVGYLKSKPDINPETVIAGGAAASWAFSGLVGLAAYGAGLAVGYVTASAYNQATAPGTKVAPGTGPATPPGSPW